MPVHILYASQGIGGDQVISTAQKADFHNRIARINAGTGTCKTTVFVGQESQFTYTPRNKRNQAGRPINLGGASRAIAAITCVVAGFAAYGLARYGEWLAFGAQQSVSAAGMAQAQSAAISLAIALLLTHLMGLRDRGLLLPKVLGVVAGILFFHNVVHAWPMAFETLFSPGWVAQVMAETEPGSVNLAGANFTL